MGITEKRLNAVVGALVSGLVGMVLPFGPLFGGLVAGYMEGGDGSDGFRVGALSGVIGLLPAMLVGALVFGLVAVIFLGIGVNEFLAASVVTGLFVVVAFLGLAVYFVGFGALGGWLGSYVKTDTDL
ncbi:MAG: DUF5518 domain-containing protein [Haloarculaceae archaeon]